MVAYTKASHQLAGVQPLINFLETRLNARIQVRLFDDYPSILNEIDHEALDIAVLSPLVYALCSEDSGLTFLATVMMRDKPWYYSVLLARKDMAVKQIPDLKGKKVGFIDKYSASGYVVPAAFLRESGLTAGENALYKPVFLGSHERAVRALMEKQVDAIATYDGFFDFARFQIGEQKNVHLTDFRILKQIPQRIPEDALVCRSALSATAKTRLLQALKDYPKLRATPGSPLQKAFYQGFKTDDTSMYHDIKALLQELTTLEHSLSGGHQ
jgi:phosphate/phosphite/phosphonate ABC transporter binding protein